MRKIAMILFVSAAVGVLVAEAANLAWLKEVAKPLIMASLLFYYLFSCEAEHRSRALLLAIVFSFAGDVLLMNPDYFVTGLVAFLIAHVLYIFGYRQHQQEGSENSLHGLQRVRLAFPILLAGSGLVVILFPVLGDLKIPVIIYAIVLALMVINALFRYGRTTPLSFWMVFGGAVLFMISDSLLAINKFLTPLAFGGFSVMLTYVIAQYLIIQGLLKHPHQ